MEEAALGILRAFISCHHASHDNTGCRRIQISAKRCGTLCMIMSPAILGTHTLRIIHRWLELTAKWEFRTWWDVSAVSSIS